VLGLAAGGKVAPGVNATRLRHVGGISFKNNVGQRSQSPRLALNYPPLERTVGEARERHPTARFELLGQSRPDRRGGSCGGPNGHFRPVWHSPGRPQLQKKPFRRASKTVPASPASAGDGQGRVDPRRLVFIEETWAKTNVGLLRGWAPRGQRLPGQVPYGHWKTMTFLAAL
jgi:hypothetical protein